MRPLPKNKFFRLRAPIFGRSSGPWLLAPLVLWDHLFGLRSLAPVLAPVSGSGPGSSGPHPIPAHPIPAYLDDTLTIINDTLTIP